MEKSVTVRLSAETCEALNKFRASMRSRVPDYLQSQVDSMNESTLVMSACELAERYFNKGPTSDD